jgi:hypothetical protein
LPAGFAVLVKSCRLGLQRSLLEPPGLLSHGTTAIKTS